MSKKSLKTKPIFDEDDDALDFDIFKHLDFNPLRTKEKPKTESIWPISDDKLYSPSLEAVRQSKKERNLEDKQKEPSFYEQRMLVREAKEAKEALSEAIWEEEETAWDWADEEAWEEACEDARISRDDFWRRKQNEKDYSNYLRRLKKRIRKESGADKTFRNSREKSKNYYIFQKRQALSYKHHSLLRLLFFYKRSLRDNQRNDFFFFLRHLQEERHHISLLYEDYILPLKSKNHIKMNLLLHEYRYKNRFLMELHQKQHHAFHLFKKRQQCERMLHFLWCLKNFQLLRQEKAQLQVFKTPPSFALYPSSPFKNKDRPYPVQRLLKHWKKPSQNARSFNHF